jgi:hypothetical protein
MPTRWVGKVKTKFWPCEEFCTKATRTDVLNETSWTSTVSQVPITQHSLGKNTAELAIF